ncbi:hypothetical protein A2223_00835 [Candidatus Falkowbacteria bacterium RIFOXYA2_FULL_35_8]|uniref:Uncharacterized protein n=1 Tax=Candidatus Falkowbacteria bacterium RIFOXYC2_FULL_36_12 TaxID=1798002 RepID=A0A1F5T052_9BACT|nr:MAG: hypothetical protein A2478_03330 [Candidatus Falkowbacteria bacterium RIFOXYC2_FULL_36_12]OGF34545.1 MAG: hypothetical protein A2223_00835 [Candidatus Falkowbacteria bacterium RIFOXYA2_FULL_35_8]
MNENNLVDKISEQIKKENIEPKSKWGFVFKSYFFWVMFATALFFGSLACGIIFFLSQNSIVLGEEKIKVLSLVIGFWFVALTVLIYLSYLNFQHTKHGYKYNQLLVVVICVFASVAIGFGLYSYADMRIVENSMYNKFPMYRQVFKQGFKNSFKPDEGNLLGVVMEIGDQQFLLDDIRGQDWQILFKNVQQLKRGERVHVIGRVLVKPADRMGFIMFEADDVLPMLRGPMFCVSEMPCFERK